MSKKRQLEQSPEVDDADLFRAAMRDTKPLADNNRHQPRSKPTTPVLQRRRSAKDELLETLLEKEAEHSIPSASDPLEYRSSGVQDRLMRNFKRGQYRREDELDLHGLTVDKARVELAEFMLKCQQRGYRCVRIIHGKGLRSGERGPVLKNKLAGWLTGQKTVMAFCPALRTEGGSGAVMLLLRSPKN